MSGPSAQDVLLLYRAGRLKYKLHAGQRLAYDQIRAWQKECERKRTAGEDFVVGQYSRVFYLSCARRYGKDFLSLIMALEDCFSRKNALITYACAQHKDVVSIAIPLISKILEDCPEKMRPTFRNAHQGGESGYSFPSTNATLRLIGIERNVDAIRGRWSDGVYISEAGFVENLKYAVETVIQPMFVNRPWSSIVLNSTPPLDPSHDLTNVFEPDCIERGTRFLATIYDNPMVSEAERKELFRSLGGPLSPTARRELMCETIRDNDTVVLPEFDKDRHVKNFTLPKYGRAYTVIDPGFRDLAGVLCFVHDFERGKLLVVSEWARSGANTSEIATAVKNCEGSVANLQYWDQDKFKRNPATRWSDTELRLIADLSRQYQLPIQQVDKDGAEAALHALRTALQLDRIEIHPTCVKTIEHFEKAIWNKNRTSYERNSRIGHADLVDVAKYAYRMINRELNPFPPPGIELEKNVSFDNLYTRPEYRVSPRRGIGKLSEVLPQRRFRAKGR